jgi:nicotinamidase-related amidase
MTVTAIDPRTALVLIDLQNGITALVDPAALAEPVARAADLAASFRARGLPVILVRTGFAPDGADAPRNRTSMARPAGSPPPNWTEPLVAVDQRPSDVVVIKHQPGAFHGTDLDLQLRRRGVTGIVLGGVATSLGVESTGRAGYDHGYNLTFAADAMTDPDLDAHEHSLRVTFPKFGEVGTAAAIATAIGVPVP